MSTRGGPGTFLRRILGLALVALILGFLAFTLAIYNKAFSPVVAVTVHTDKVGNQLLPQADVKVRGIPVGEVRAIRGSADGAELSLAIQPDKAAMLPDNVSVRLLPKTLFGDRFVDLEIPARRSGEPLSDGDRILQDHSARATELDTALNNLMPVLRAVQPQKLSATLTAVSTALRGRGKQLGRTLSELGRYVGELNPELPNITHDLRALADVADTYSDATPDLVRALDDLTVTSRTVASQKQNLDSLYSSLSGAAQTLRSFLEANKRNLIRVARDSLPTLGILAKYSPEYPCLLKGLAGVVPKSAAAFGAGTDQPGLHLTLEVTTNRGKYEPGRDDPVYEDTRGPRCYDPKDYPTPFPQYPPDGPIRDGTSSPPAARTSTDGGIPGLLGGRVAGTSTSPQSSAPRSATPEGALAGSGLPNSTAERGMLAELFAGQLGRQPKDMPSWASLLLGPLARGTEVTLK
ncbi:MAG: MCE family protein [Sciscionella sp.]